MPPLTLTILGGELNKSKKSVTPFLGRDPARPQHRHLDRRRHRDECLLRVDGARRDDAELQGFLCVGCERLPDHAEHNATLASMMVMFADVRSTDEMIALLQGRAAATAAAAE